MPEDAPETAPRARLAVALGATLLLAGVIAGVLVLGGGSQEPATPAAASDCINAWNEDELATSYGRHNAVAHKYEDVQVTRLELADGQLVESARGECAVIFGAVELDREPDAAGQLLRGETWTPLSLLAGVELDRVAQLQSVAVENANASIDEQGRLSQLRGR